MSRIGFKIATPVLEGPKTVPPLDRATLIAWILILLFKLDTFNLSEVTSWYAHVTYISYFIPTLTPFTYSSCQIDIAF
jgi:hypothetical protein